MAITGEDTPTGYAAAYAAGMELTATQRRVLGCLIEKQLTTPQAYPLTESAVITACNQTTNRNPIVAYDQSTVRRALLDLRQLGLARMIHRPGDRVEKHRHLVAEALELSPAEVAVLCVLLLRGPQTVGELRTRTERMHAFENLSDVEDVLEALSRREPEALVARVERLPGQSQARYQHLLTPPDEEPVEPSASAPTPRPRSAGAAASEVEQLRAEVAELRARVERLEAG